MEKEEINSEILAKLLEENRKLKEENEALRRKEEADQKEIQYLKELLRLNQNLNFAKKSEKINKDQMSFSLFNDVELNNEIAKLEDKIEENKEITVKGYSRKKKPNLINDNTQLPVEIVDVTLDEDGLEDIHCDDITRRLVVIPKQYKILEIHRHVYRKIVNGESVLVRNEKDYINPLGKTMVSSSIVSEIICNKVINALPLYRQEMDYKNKGINLSRQDMSNYCMQVAELLEPITERIKEEINDAEIARSDETPLNIIKKDGKKLESKSNSYVWVFSTGNGFNKATYYQVGPGRDRDVINDFFVNKKQRYLMSDGYGAYASIPYIDNVYCLTHIRRKFLTFDKKDADKDAPMQNIIKMIANIYHVDNEIHEKFNNFTDIKNERLKSVKPLCDDLFSYIELNSLKVLPKSAQGRAFEYALKCKDGFMKVFEDGRLDLDNNASERAVKPFVIGRKNWLFAQTIDGAKATCSLYSILRTAVINGLKPEDYLTYVIDKLGIDQTYPIDELMPWSEKIPNEIKL